MSEKVYYVISAEVRDVDGTVRVYESGAKKLCSCVAIYLLCADTGCVMRRSVLTHDNGSIDIVGIGQDSIVKFASGLTSIDQAVVSWDKYGALHLPGNLLFLCVVDLFESFLMPYDDRWDLSLTGAYEVGYFRYKLVPKGVYTRRVMDTDIMFCSFLHCYFEVLARLQNRVMLAGASANSREFVAIATRQLCRIFDKADLHDSPYAIGIQNLRLLVAGKSNICGAFGFRFEVTDVDIKRAASMEQPFLFIATRENECEVLKSAVEESSPETVIQIV